MPKETTESRSQLIPVLREGLSVIQMILFKEIRQGLACKYPSREPAFLSMLAGAVTNELFGSPNPEEKFVRFRQGNRGIIEQELLGIQTEKPELRAPLTDALRVQALCDSQEGIGEDTVALIRADELGILIRDRDIPLPSTFMTMVRELGKQHNLIVPPAQISTEQDRQMLH